MTVTINLYKRSAPNYLSTTSKLLGAYYFISNRGFYNVGPNYNNTVFFDAAPADVLADPTTYFPSRAAADAYLDSKAWMNIIAGLNGATGDPLAGTYVQGSFVDNPQEVIDATAGSASEVLTATVTSGIATFTFAKTYASAPKVVAQIVGGGDATHGALCYISSVSTTGATVYAMKTQTNTVLILNTAVDPDTAVANGTVVELIVYA